jgi:hypothetical protein
MVRWVVAAVLAWGLTLFSREAVAGYTHVWVFKETPDPALVAKATEAMRKVIAKRPNLVEVAPGDALKFNGKGDLAQEDFVFPGRVGTNAVWTEKKPYDEVVTACLLVARDYFTKEQLELKSDGDWLAWQDGILLYAETFGSKPNNPGIAEHNAFHPGGKMPNVAERDRFRDPRTRPWAIVIMLCFAGLIVLLLIPTKPTELD